MLVARGCLSITFVLAAGSVAADYGPLAAEAVEGFAPLSGQDLAAAKARLSEAAAAVEELLDPNSEQGAAWLSYLQWEGVTAQLAPDSRPDLGAAGATLRRLSSGAAGLERPELQDAAAAIEHFVGVARFALAPAERQQRSFAAAANGLAQLLGSGLTDARAAFQAERRLALLTGVASGGNGAALLDAVRDGYGGSNVRIQIESTLLDRLLGRAVDDCSPVTDCILGTSIRGSGATTGHLSVRPLENADRGRLLFTLSGTTRSRTTGYNGPAVIRSTGVTRFSATKLVELTDESFRLSPASASATTRSTTQSVSKRGGGIGSGLVEKIGARRVAEKKPQADAIAADHAEDRIAANLDSQLAEAIADARHRYEDRFRKPLRQRLASPRQLRMQTTGESMHVDATFASASQLAAPASDTPAGTDGSLCVCLHQSAVNNLLDAYLGGVTIRRDSVEEPARLDVVAPTWLKLKAEPPKEGEEFRPWAMRLRSPRPVSVEFAEGQITAILHAAEFRVEEKSYEGWDLIAKFRPEQGESRWRLVRQGPIDVLPTRFDPSRPGRLSSGEVGLRNNLAKALNEPEDRLPLEVEIDPIDLSDRDAPIDQLSMVAILIDGGWLSAGWVAP